MDLPVDVSPKPVHVQAFLAKSGWFRPIGSFEGSAESTTRMSGAVKHIEMTIPSFILVDLQWYRLLATQ
jgi:hypothetical protein